MEKHQIQNPEEKELGIDDIERIEKMPEETTEEIAAKKQDYNDLIITLDRAIPAVHKYNESGTDHPDDNSQEIEQDTQDFGLIRNSMSRAREEMVRLGDKLQQSDK